MLPFIIRHALENVWCSPEQDRQAIITLNRASRPGGQLGYIDLQWSREYLPNGTDYFAVYVIGQNSPYRLNLPTEESDWMSFSELSRTRGINIELYTDSGLMFANEFCFLRRTKNRNFVIAVKRQDVIADLDFVTPSVRFYSNAYFDSSRADHLAQTVSTKAIVVGSMAEALAFQGEMHTLRNTGAGRVLAFRNGEYVNDYLPSLIAVGDILEYRHDTSIKTVYEFSSKQVPSFLSALDSQQKYLLHPPKALDVIDYQDDVDVYIVKKNAGLRDRGLYYHKNRPYGLRNVTHHDYSLSANQLQEYIEGGVIWDETDDLTIMLFVKHAGYARPLIDEHSRIKELYKLTDTEIVTAMLGTAATLEEWRASALEASAYTKIMRSSFKTVSTEDVVAAYGYNSLANIHAKVYHRVVGDRVQLPVGLQNNATIFEYDNDGLLLSWRQHNGSATYYTQHVETTFVEVLSGLGGNGSPIEVGNLNYTVEKDQSYRMYTTSVVGGVISNNWTDVTGTPKAVRIGDTVYWSIDTDGERAAIVNNLYFTCYDLVLSTTDLVYQFSIAHKTYQGLVVKIPPGRVDIFMNGHSLIKDIDYHLDFPRVTILTSKYLKPGSQNLTIRCTGYCNEEMEVLSPYDSGFVKYGMLSVDNQYDVREDKSVSFVVGGRRYLYDQLDFAEDGRNFTVPALTNGLPFAIEEYLVPVRNVLDYNTYPYLAESQDLDSRVSGYLTQKLPQPVNPGISMIPQKYSLYSPFLARAISDVQNGYLVPTSPFAPDAHVSEVVGPTRLALLETDPCLNANIDPSYVHIRPHPLNTVLSVTAVQYAFLERLIAQYLNGRVDLTAFVTIQE